MPNTLKKRHNRKVILVILGTLGTLGIVLLGTILLVEDARRLVSSMIFNLPGSVITFFKTIPGDFWTILLGLATLILAYFIVRQGALAMIPRFKNQICPRCGKNVRRVHRTRLDKLIGFLWQGHFGRYQCTQCNWKGLQRQHRHSHRSKHQPQETVQN